MAASPIIAVLSGWLCSFGHLQVVGWLEDSFSPPLWPMGNMGQYGFVFLTLGIGGTALGASIAFLSPLGIGRWLVLYCLLTLGLCITHGRLIASYGLMSVFFIALLMVTTVVPCIAMIWHALKPPSHTVPKGDDTAAADAPDSVAADGSLGRETPEAYGSDQGGRSVPG